MDLLHSVVLHRIDDISMLNSKMCSIKFKLLHLTSNLAYQLNKSNKQNRSNLHNEINSNHI